MKNCLNTSIVCATFMLLTLSATANNSTHCAARSVPGAKVTWSDP